MKPSRARRGSVYIIVLSSMSVSMIVVAAGLLAARAHAGRVATLAESARAARAAESGLEAALANVRRDLWWRRTVASPMLSMTFPDGSASVTLTDPDDGNLANDSTGTVLITSTGTSGGARRIFSVRATPNLAPATVLSYSMVVGGNLTLDTSKFWCRSPVHANGNIVLQTSTTLDAPVTVTGSASGSGLASAATTGVAAVTLPRWADLEAEYTAIGSSGVMGSTGAITLSYTLISPAHPPWALSANASGVYVIDLQGRRLTLDSCRVNGTLVLKNATGGVRVTGTTFWDPAVSGYPALLADGALSLTLSRVDQIESSYPKNMNPVGAPYQGSADADTSDRYAPEFFGLVYATGDLTMSGGFSSTAPLLIGGNATVAAAVGIARGVPPLTGAPALRASPEFLLDRSTWQRRVD